MTESLNLLWEALQGQRRAEGPEAEFIADMWPGQESALMAVDREARPAVLIPERGAQQMPAYRLQNIAVEPRLTCTVKKGHQVETEVLTVVRCLADAPDLQQYFIRVCDSFVAQLQLSTSRVGVLISQVAELFSALSHPSGRVVQGLWAELLLIEQAGDPDLVATTWHVEATDAYDFNLGQQRLELKSTQFRRRQHRFSMRQLDVPADARLVVASCFVEGAGGGTSLRELLDRTRARVSKPSTRLRIEETIARHLGADWRSGMEMQFDYQVAISSLAYIDSESAPRIRSPLPVGVTEVSFVSDLDGAPLVRADEMRARGGLFAAVATV